MPLAPSIESVFKDTTIEAIRASTAATCELLDPDSIPAVSLTPPRSLTAEGHLLLQTLLLDHRSWCFAKKRCLPRRTALLCLAAPRDVVRVEVGFACEGWIVTAPGERRGGFFDPVADKLKALVKGVFPEFASPHRRSIWKAGAMAQLRKQASASQSQRQPNKRS